jgi:hypothetical protein
MLILRRIRGVAISATTWAIAFAAVGLARLPVYALLGQLYPTGPDGLFGVVRRVALSGALTGFASGALFATIVMLAERRRDFATLTGRRFALWGLGAGVLFVGGANVASAIAGRWPLDLSTAAWTAFYGVVGAGIGIATFRAARRNSSVGSQGSGLLDAPTGEPLLRRS